jgi:tetraacyldisaccharide-1-P 4'-kinase
VAQCWFADHHAYRAEELRAVAEKAASAVVVTTEKDAVRLALWPQEVSPPWVLGIALEVVGSNEESAAS